MNCLKFLALQTINLETEENRPGLCCRGSDRKNRLALTHSFLQLIDRELRNRLKSSNTCSKIPKNWPLGINEYFRDMNCRPAQNRRGNDMKLMNKHLIENTKLDDMLASG